MTEAEAIRLADNYLQAQGLNIKCDKAVYMSAERLQDRASRNPSGKTAEVIPHWVVYFDTSDKNIELQEGELIVDSPSFGIVYVYNDGSVEPIRTL